MGFILTNAQYEHINNVYTSILSNEINEKDYQELTILELLQVKAKLVDKLNAFGVIDVTTLKNEIAKIWKENDEKFQEKSNEIYDIEKVFKSRKKNYIKSELPTVVK